MEKLDCCIQGQCHSKILKCEWMFVQMISSESLNLFKIYVFFKLFFFTKLGIVMHHYEPDEVFFKELFKIFMLNVFKICCMNN